MGGGTVAERKVESLLECGASVRVVATQASARLLDLSQTDKVTLINRPYQSQDMSGAFVVVAATDDEQVNRQVFADADAQNTPCNVVDVPELCSFIVPAIVTRGDLTIAISTNGKSPSFSKLMRQRIEAQIGPEYAEYLKLMVSVRRRVRRRYKTVEERQAVWQRIQQSDVLAALRAGDRTQAKEIIKTCL